MEIVALHLQIEANKRSESDGRDIFGRSAYNRYYYATFLIIRGMISSFDAKWSSIPHATYPEILSGAIQKTFRDEKRRAVKASDSEMIQICEQAISAARTLSELMKTGSTTRVIADYQPEVSVKFEDASRFSLQGVNITEAHQWPITARNLTVIIDRAWRQIHD